MRSYCTQTGSGTNQQPQNKQPPSCACGFFFHPDPIRVSAYETADADTPTVDLQLC